MGDRRIAFLGGDRRELHIARLLADDGYTVALYACSPTDGSGLRNEETARAAVAGAQWIICPSPGLGAGDTVYAPGSPASVSLDEELLSASDAAEGGLVLGKATSSVAAAAERLGIAVYEMKDDRALAVSNATSVAEAVMQLLIGNTERLLREHRVLVIGYGATGAAITDYLLAARCTVTVAARGAEHRARAQQRGAASTPYADRVPGLTEADIVVNTVPDTDAVPVEAFASLGDRLVVDIASPPGGLDHSRAEADGCRVIWARGLAGRRAPFSVGEAQLAFVRRAMAARAAVAAHT